MNIERVTTLLASGLKPSHVASIVGVSPARISQLMSSDKEFQDLLLKKNAEAEKEDIEEKALGSKYHAAEHLLLDQVLQMAPVSELRDVTAALRVVAERQEKFKTRMNPIVQSSSVLQTIVQISLPSHSLPAPEITLTREREVMSIDARNLAPLSSTGVTNLFSKMRAEEENKHDATRILIPAKETSTESIEEEVLPSLLEA